MGVRTGPGREHDGSEGLRPIFEAWWTSLRLGLTSFGGPIAHLGYFEHEYVQRRRWLTAAQYANLVALAQVLPGPASSQVNFLVGLHRGGGLGAIAAWLGFTLPSALLMYAAAAWSARAQGPLAQGVLHGLQLVAVAVVAQAVWSMARRLCRDLPTAGLALLAAALLLLVGGTLTQLGVLVLGAVAGAVLCRAPPQEYPSASVAVRAGVAWTSLALFLLLLVLLPLLATREPVGIAALADVFYRAGALVFGGGHVVLPLLRDALVPGGWITDERFLAGYGFAQAVPGPLFTFAAYLGASDAFAPSPAWGAAVAVVFIFLPGLLIAIAGAALWSRVALRPRARATLAGVNAVVVGILAAALYDPVWTTGVHVPVDAAIAITGVALLTRWRVAPIWVVVFCVAAGALQACVR